MFRVFFQTLWVSVLVSAVCSYLFTFLLYFVRQYGAPFSLGIPEVIFGVLVTGVVLGIFYSIILFGVREKSMLVRAVACGMFDLLLWFVGAIIGKYWMQHGVFVFHLIGIVSGFIKGGAIAYVTSFALEKLGFNNQEAMA